MKKVLLLLVAAVFTLLSANAQTGNDLVISAGETKEITLGENMKVVLIVTDSPAQDVNLSKEVLEKLDVRFSENELQINARKDLENVTVYVVVNSLKQVTLGYNTSITNQGFLRPGKLEVFVHPGASAVLRTIGKIEAYSLGDFDVTIKRTSLYSGVSASIN